ncbi:transcriptional regulator [Listeria monocytogenes]|nr:transcriptional regulator [Listeria monocytogenes]EJV0593934.1 transcriptional regulator [Listeria monocytogenes]
MSKLIGISENSYRNKEKGSCEFKSSEMFAIAEKFNLPIEKIFLKRKVTKRNIGVGKTYSA